MNKEKLTMSENIRALELVFEGIEALYSPFISIDCTIEKLEKIRNGTMVFHYNIVEAVKDERDKKE